ncbi:MAG: LacI family DNA-binding transcriptional regulator [Gorillibacterium sp.]|nr:LacI family DNA-binding transcriptional regulator [Gorillibacterium sp.]
MAKKITMQQIAAHLGVSKYVVSKALSGKAGVSAVTRERVLQTAAQLGYYVSKSVNIKEDPFYSIAEKKASTIKRTVVVLMPNIRFQTKKNLYWGRILEGISSEIEAKNLSMVIITERNEQVLNLFHKEELLGAIVVGKAASGPLLDIHRAEIPLVLIDHDDPLVPADSVFVNNYDCTARLTSHLIGLGHRAMRFIGPINYSRSFLERWIGFRMTLEEHRLEPVREENIPYQTDRAENAEAIAKWLHEIMATDDRPTALMCANDDLALATLMALKGLGIRVPEEMTVTGFDNIEDAYHSEPGLSTINVPKEALGKRAVETLLLRLDNPNAPYGKYLMVGEMILRESVGTIN